MLCAAFALSSCSAERERVASGYVEGEYVYVAAPEGGWVTELLVSRGQSVKVGDALFALDADAQLAQRNQAAATLAQAKAQLANVLKGRRPDEIAALVASLEQARANFALAASEFKRANDLKRRGVVSQSFFDIRRAQRDVAEQQVKQIQANVSLSLKGAREDEIESARANVGVANAALTKFNYVLSQRRILAKVDGRECLAQLTLIVVLLRAA